MEKDKIKMSIDHLFEILVSLDKNEINAVGKFLEIILESITFQEGNDIKIESIEGNYNVKNIIDCFINIFNSPDLDEELKFLILNQFNIVGAVLEIHKEILNKLREKEDIDKEKIATDKIDNFSGFQTSREKEIAKLFFNLGWNSKNERDQ